MGFINPGQPSTRRRNKRRRQSPTPQTHPVKKSKKSHPPHPPLSSLESLPTEILQQVFLHSLNPSLASSSLHLTHVLAARHLQLQYLYANTRSPAHLTGIFRFRFFNVAFLNLFESHFNITLSATHSFLPLRLLTAAAASSSSSSWNPPSLELIKLLVDRGATLDPGERDIHLESLHSAILLRRKDVVKLFVEIAGLRVDTFALRLAVEHMPGDLEICALLGRAGADLRDVGVWRVAMEGRKGEEVVKWLMEREVPPGEIMGELFAFLEGGKVGG